MEFLEFISGNSISEENMLDIATDALANNGTFCILTSGSAPIDVAIGSYSFLSQDVFRDKRGSNFNAGFEKFLVFLL